MAGLYGLDDRYGAKSFSQAVRQAIGWRFPGQLALHDSRSAEARSAAAATNSTRLMNTIRFIERLQVDSYPRENASRSSQVGQAAQTTRHYGGKVAENFAVYTVGTGRAPTIRLRLLYQRLKGLTPVVWVRFAARRECDSLRERAGGDCSRRP